jgi:hypothetical protein
VIWINIIKKVKTSFDNISRISEIILILGQLFILFLLLGSLAYIIFNLYIANNTGIIAELMLVGTLARENAVITLAIIWGGSLFIDYIEKHENR